MGVNHPTLIMIDQIDRALNGLLVQATIVTIELATCSNAMAVAIGHSSGFLHCRAMGSQIVTQ
jgi:hypothetical protein